MKNLFLAAIITLFALPAFAEDSITPFTPDTFRAVIDFPLLEIPFTWENHFYMPSMSQAIGASKGFYEGIFLGVDYLADRIIPPEKMLFLNILAQDAVSFGLIYLSSYLPLGTGWAHEEFHRAVLWQNKISSYNTIYDFKFFSKTIAVNRVDDSSLVRLKQENNTELVRAHAAGYEGQQKLMLEFEKDAFFRNLPYSLSSAIVFNWYSTMTNIVYINKAASVNGDSLTAQMNRSDGSRMERRDFTGLDFTAWTYDLFRPDTPYAARGVHPSGTGLDRYISYGELTDEEKDFLDNESNVAWLSIVNPMLFGVNRIPLGALPDGRRASLNFNLRHSLAPFGRCVDLNLFFALAPFNVFLAYHHMENRSAVFPALEAQLVDFPLSLLGQKNVLATIRIIGWTQPEDMGFRTKKDDYGALASMRFMYQIVPWLRVSAEFEGKSDGWVAGNVYLEQMVSGKLGIVVFVK